MNSTLVVDASAILAVLIDPADRGEIVAARPREADVIAPAHLPIEVINVLRRRNVAGLLHSSQAHAALAAFWAMSTRLWPIDLLAERMWRLRSNLSADDAGYVALAEMKQAPLITCDARIARASGVRVDVEVF